MGRTGQQTPESLQLEHQGGEGDGTPLQYSCLENPRDGEAWWAAVYGVTQSRTWLKWLSSSSRTSGKQLLMISAHSTGEGGQARVTKKVKKPPHLTAMTVEEGLMERSVMLPCLAVKWDSQRATTSASTCSHYILPRLVTLFLFPNSKSPSSSSNWQTLRPQPYREANSYKYIYHC